MDTLKQLIKTGQLEQIFPRRYFPFLTSKTIKSGQAICKQGEDLTVLSYFVEGKVKIVRSQSNGKDYILEITDEPRIFGDVELLSHKQTVSSVIALEDCTVIQLPLEEHRASLLADADFLYLLCHRLALTLHDQNIKASTNLSYTVKERLATHILAIQSQDRFQLELATLADSFGTSYRHLLRVIKEFIAQGMISKEKRVYTILNRQKLEDLFISD